MMTQEATGSGVPAETPVSEQMTDERRDELASQVVERFTFWSGAAGLIPVPLIDIAAVGGVQVLMLQRLSEIYNVPFSQNRGKSIIASLAGSLVPASTATTSAMTIGSLIKGVPGIGWAVGVVTMPAFSACATYVIGKVFVQHFASGGTLLDFNAPDYREFIKAQKERFSARSAAPPQAAQPQAAQPTPLKRGASSTGAATGG
jgi:uncharacterized protein (DUF697 family)